MEPAAFSSRAVKRACEDFRYLLDRGYRRSTAVNIVSGHYRLSKKERNFVLRKVNSKEEIRDHKKRKVTLQSIRGKTLVIDGYNVLIATECALGRASLLKSQDGFHRDALGVFGRYKTSNYTTPAIDRILVVLKKHRPAKVVFLFDAQVSRSGQLAGTVRHKLKEAGLEGDARTSPSADYEIKSLNQITASSDSAIIEKVSKVVDLVGALS